MDHINYKASSALEERIEAEEEKVLELLETLEDTVWYVGDQTREAQSLLRRVFSLRDKLNVRT